MGRTRSPVVVIGAGVVGCSTAYHLARMGATGVLVVEKEKFVGSGSTALNAGGIRATFSTDINIALSVEAIRMFERMEEELGCPIEYHQAGYLWLARSAAQWDGLRSRAPRQRAAGVEVELLQPSEVAERFPFVRTEDLSGAALGVRDGYADPHMVAQGYWRRARELGVRFELDTLVLGIESEGGRVKSVRTSNGTIECEVVVDCAGPFARQVAALAGIDLPAHPVRRCLWVTHPFDRIPGLIPLTIDMDTGFYCRKESGAIMMGLANEAEPSSFNTQVDWEFFEHVIECAVHRVPLVAEAGIHKAWAGLYSVTPDRHMVLGRVPGLEGFLVAAGFSGHGFMHSPIVGKLTAEAVLHGAPRTLDCSPLAITRFQQGELIHEENVI
ncbi:MAG: FAD-binding oxidoreductase [Planctomycetes bacterium]|nr:FAD-binding oxidoreductase [Planctomycetota bacterium]